jgi:hypothetical protein
MLRAARRGVLRVGGAAAFLDSRRRPVGGRWRVDSQEPAPWLDEDQVAKREAPLYVNVDGTQALPDDAQYADDRSEYHDAPMHPYLPQELLQQQQPSEPSSAQRFWLSVAQPAPPSASPPPRSTSSASPPPRSTSSASVRRQPHTARSTAASSRHSSAAPSRLSSAVHSVSTPFAAAPQHHATTTASTRSHHSPPRSVGASSYRSASSAALPPAPPRVAAPRSSSSSWLPAPPHHMSEHRDAPTLSPVEGTPKSTRGRAWNWLQRKVFRKAAKKDQRGENGGYLGRL